MLQECNNLTHVKVSLDYPVLAAFFLNTSVFVDMPLPNQAVYVNDSANNNQEGTYLNALGTVVDTTQNTINNMTYDQLNALPITDFDTNGLLANETRILFADNIHIDYMPIMGLSEYINDFTIDNMNKTMTLFHRWVELSGLETMHRGIIFDTELQWGANRNYIYSTYWNYTFHQHAMEELGQMIQTCKEWEYSWKTGYTNYSDSNWNTYVFNPRLSFIASATFGMHMDDLWDLDAAQQNLFKVTIIPPSTETQFDFTGMMTYENGPNSLESLYGYCRAGDYYFGNKAVPYLFSNLGDPSTYNNNISEYMAQITQKFQLVKNYGYSFMGIWALTYFFCDPSQGSNGCNGLYNLLSAYNDTNAIYNMCVALNNTNPAPVTFSANAYNFAYAHPALVLLDAYLISPQVYSGWPIAEATRIRGDTFI